MTVSPPSPPTWLDTINGAIDGSIGSHISTAANGIANAMEDSISGALSDKVHHIAVEWTTENWGTLVLIVVLVLVFVLCCIYSWISSACKCLKCTTGVIFCNCGCVICCMNSRGGYVASVFVQAIVIGVWVFCVLLLIARLPFCALADLRVLTQVANASSCEVPHEAELSPRAVNLSLLVSGGAAAIAFFLGLLPLLGCESCQSFGCVRYTPDSPNRSSSNVLHVNARAPRVTTYAPRSYGSLEEGQRGYNTRDVPTITLAQGRRSKHGTNTRDGYRWQSKHTPMTAAEWHEL